MIKEYSSENHIWSGINYVWNLGNPKSLNVGKIGLSLLSKISLGGKR
jgi:hypothetical protein